MPKLKEFYFNDNDLSCHRVTSILSTFKENGVKGFYKTKERTRFYTVKVVDKIECLTEVQWSSVYYKKIAQQLTKDINEIKTGMKSALMMINKEHYKLKHDIEALKAELVRQNNILKALVYYPEIYYSYSTDNDELK